MGRYFVLATLVVVPLASVAQPVDFLFAPAYQTGTAPYSVRLADMDGDGDLDAVTVDLQDQETGTLSLHWNDGKGRFTPGPQYPVGAGASWMEVGDLNNDGRPDVLVSNSQTQATDSVSVFLNMGGGILALTGHISEEGNAGPQGIEVGDFNADGKADVAVAYDWLGVVTVYFGNGLGQFPTKVSKSPGITPRDIAAADFNNDGKLDFIVNSVNSSVVFFGTNGNFTQGPYLDNFQQGEADHIVAGDFDNDGDQDFVTTGQNLTLYRNDGAGLVWSKTHSLVGENPVGLAKGDFDGDGNLDVAAAVYLGNAVSVYYGDGQGNFTLRRDWGVGLAPNDLYAGDVDGDGRSDIVAVSSQLSQTDFQLLINAGDRTYLGRLDYDVVGSAAGFATADYDHDGQLDVAVAVSQSNNDNVRVARGLGDGNLAEALAIEHFGNNMPTNIIQADFNRDGWADLAASIFSPGNRMRVWLNDGTGGFLPSQSYAAGGNPSSLAAGDLNGDGVLDVVVVNAAQTDNTISIFIGNPDGTFQPGYKIPTLFRPSDVAIADWDKDGDLDPLITHVGQAAILVFVNDGFGNFTPKAIQLGVTQGTPTAVDLDADGWMDVALTTGQASALINDKNGGFVLRQTGIQAGAVGIGDFDFNGTPDLVAILGFQSLAQILLNDGTGHFALQRVVPVGYDTGRSNGVDLNHDGLPELLTANYRAGSLSVVQNTTWNVPTAISAFRGVVVQGGLQDVRVSDDSRWVVRKGIVANGAESPIMARFEAKSPKTLLASVGFTVESRASTVGLTQVVELYDWTAGQYVEMDSRSATLADQRVTVTTVDPKRFVQPGTRLMRAQVRVRQTGVVSTNSWTSSFDFTAWTVR